jgi:hypothetical protein
VLVFLFFLIFLMMFVVFSASVMCVGFCDDIPDGRSLLVFFFFFTGGWFGRDGKKLFILLEEIQMTNDERFVRFGCAKNIS